MKTFPDETTTVRLDVIPETTNSPSVPRKEVSPRLLAAGGFKDEQTNLVREDGVGSGEVSLPEEEESTGSGETIFSFKSSTFSFNSMISANLQTPAWSLLFLCILPPLCQVFLHISNPSQRPPIKVMLLDFPR